MKYVLNVIDLANEDVIVTSSSCANSILYGISNSGTTVNKFTSGSNPEEVTSSFSGVEIPTTNGYYHFENGEFVECPAYDASLDDQTNLQNLANAHGLEISNLAG